MVVKYLVFAVKDLTQDDINRINSDFVKGICIGVVGGPELLQNYVKMGLLKEACYIYFNWEESQWIIENICPRANFVVPSLVWLSERDRGAFTLMYRIYHDMLKYGFNKCYFNAIGLFHDRIDFLKFMLILETYVSNNIIRGYGINAKIPNMLNFPDVVQHILPRNGFVLIEGAATSDDDFLYLFVIPILSFKSPGVDVVVHVYTPTGTQYWSNNVLKILDDYGVGISIFERQYLSKVWEWNSR